MFLRLEGCSLFSKLATFFTVIASVVVIIGFFGYSKISDILKKDEFQIMMQKSQKIFKGNEKLYRTIFYVKNDFLSKPLIFKNSDINSTYVLFDKNISIDNFYIEKNNLNTRVSVEYKQNKLFINIFDLRQNEEFKIVLFTDKAISNNDLNLISNAKCITRNINDKILIKDNSDCFLYITILVIIIISIILILFLHLKSKQQNYKTRVKGLIKQLFEQKEKYELQLKQCQDDNSKLVNENQQLTNEVKNSLERILDVSNTKDH